MSINYIQYLGHSAIILESNKLVIAIDPWLSGNPSCPERFANPSRLDLIFLTHGHSDHAGDTVRLAKHTGAYVAATFELAMLLTAEGIPQEKVIPMNKGGSTEFGDITLTLTHAMHSNSYDTEQGPKYAGEACGVIINDGKHSFYHAGDTAVFSDMKLISQLYAPNFAFLPIGDRFTMGPKEAALATSFIKPKAVIPVHYKTFDALTGTADEYKEQCQKIAECKGVAIHALNPGERLAVNS